MFTYCHTCHRALSLKHGQIPHDHSELSCLVSSCHGFTRWYWFTFSCCVAAAWQAHARKMHQPIMKQAWDVGFSWLLTICFPSQLLSVLTEIVVMQSKRCSQREAWSDADPAPLKESNSCNCKAGSRPNFIAHHLSNTLHASMIFCNQWIRNNAREEVPPVLTKEHTPSELFNATKSCCNPACKTVYWEMNSWYRLERTLPWMNNVGTARYSLVFGQGEEPGLRTPIWTLIVLCNRVSKIAVV